MGESYRISVQGQEADFSCREDEFILNAMTRSRCGPVHYGCFGGGCGICKMRVLAGEYIAEKKMSRAQVSQKEEEEDGIVLLCCIKPRSDILLAGVNKGEK
jgi:ferredoxin